MRAELKKPLGNLFEGEPEVNVRRISEMLSIDKPTMLASVGDFVSRHLIEKGVDPDIIVVDFRIMRFEVKPYSPTNRLTIPAKNRQGTIDTSLWKALRKAVMLKRKTSVIVEGEEDLAVIPLIELMPLGSMIIYGQPNQGMVVVIINEELKRWAERFLKRMEEAQDENRIKND